MFISTYCNVKKHLLWCNVWMHRLQGWLRKSKMLKSQSWPAILQYCRTLNVMFVPGRGFICKTLTWYCLKNKFARFATMSHHLVADGRPLQLHVDRKKKKKNPSKCLFLCECLKTKADCFIFASLQSVSRAIGPLHAAGMWKETGEPRGNPHMGRTWKIHKKRTQARSQMVVTPLFYDKLKSYSRYKT